MELLVKGVFDAIGGGLKALFGQLVELLLLAGVVMSGEDSVFAAGAVLTGEVAGRGLSCASGRRWCLLAPVRKGLARASRAERVTGPLYERRSSKKRSDLL